MPSRLATLLAQNRELSPEYGGGLSNHLSMGLRALSALGASEERLVEFAEASLPALEPLAHQQATEVTHESFARSLRRPPAFTGFRTLFQRELRTLGRSDALRKYVPTLLPGIAAAGFHALIRTAYGIRFDDDEEIADGLAYWATAFLPLGSLEEPGTQASPRALLDQIRAYPGLGGHALEGRLILVRMQRASELEAFPGAVAALAPGRDTLAQLAAVALRLYTSTGGDFTALHTVTGAHAFRVLQPFLRADGPGVRYLWQAFVAAYIALGTPEIVEPTLPATLPVWDEIVAAAVRSNDAHDIKLVDTAREESGVYRDGSYQHAAALRLKLV
jgi:questin oxidase-like protein